MKSRKRLSVIALLSVCAVALAVGGRLRPASLQAAPALSSAASANAHARLANAALREVSANNLLALDDDGLPMRVGEAAAMQGPIFPPVRQFTLTPPASESGQTVFSVRFPQSPAVRLPSQIPMTLEGQNVVLQRSAADPGLFVANLNFDWQKFAAEQGQRKLAAEQGRMIPIFDGRNFVGTGPMQFIEPEEIEQALQMHQTLHFTPLQLSGSPLDVFPDHQLMMTGIPVVQDNGLSSPGAPARTFDQCLAPAAQGSATGAWTFNTLMMAIAGNPTNPQVAEQMLLNMLSSWNADQTVNQQQNGSFTVFARKDASGHETMGVLNSGNPSQNPPPTGLLGNWPIDVHTSCVDPNSPITACPSLTNAPVRLDAIVNRLDLGQNGSPFPQAGELRFVFTVTTSLCAAVGQACTAPPNPCSPNGGLVMNIILEFNVPGSFNKLQWAQKWAALPDLNSGGTFSETYLTALQGITDLVVKAGDCGGTCIAQIRTNEILLAPSSGKNHGLWELREFHFSNSGGTPTLSEATVAQTPDFSFEITGSLKCNNVNNGVCTPGTLADYINTVSSTNPIFLATNGAAPPVPPAWRPSSGNPFLGGSALNNASGVGWNDSSTINSERARIDFSFNTCNGCHGGETATTFQQVFQRQTPVQGTSSNLASFLVGCKAGNNTCGIGSQQQCPITEKDLGQGTDGPCVETIQDPNQTGTFTSFGDIARRVTYLQTVCTDSSCDGQGGNGLLLPFLNKPIGVH